MRPIFSSPFPGSPHFPISPHVLSGYITQHGLVSEVGFHGLPFGWVHSPKTTMHRLAAILSKLEGLGVRVVQDTHTHRERKRVGGADHVAVPILNR